MTKQEVDAALLKAQKIAPKKLMGTFAYHKLGDISRQIPDIFTARGFIDEWIAINLKNKPNDNETRFAITDRIEAYTASIRRK